MVRSGKISLSHFVTNVTLAFAPVVVEQRVVTAMSLDEKSAPVGPCETYITLATCKS
jgi:hypothetical protein